ncbi:MULTISPECIES: hypothetical protein [unclassified Bradyrhizobium]|uniref:hypothetical protein n=1 Tax=unclassified Bradyrhizobium TaxID=2631580 RepID=UPI001CD7073A|nr:MULTISPECIES: hypothetical protein [unclassified Bradyrhizobium]MCA1386061.1 hypothetical protein [Bradyrhizobium sp. BRP05]MCA1393859.1 hypothetical protein [Bradyrhizobium sp. IC3123]MCA1423503.1 hypothetical protein [Bradyrhizobium sp. BRP23]MCA1430603.1 hypothetical protein [Bradyrhizobium sp. NBAIM16]MCA1480114.1 hypothetical protein [Bradyrhizobium sp. NBAIM08]
MRFTVDAGKRDAQTTTADLSKLNRLEVAPTMSGNFGIVYLARSGANTVSVHTRYGDQSSNKVRLNNLAPGQIDAFLSKVAEFQEKFCSVKVSVPARPAAQSVRGRSGRSLSDAKGGPPRDHRGPAARGRAAADQPKELHRQPIDHFTIGRRPPAARPKVPHLGH